LYGYSQGADDTSRHPDNADVLHLRTDGLPTPLILPGDPLNRAVTSLEIRGELAGAGDGKGTITLDESTLTFNDFGDATRAKPKASEPSRVAFRRVKQGDKNEKRRLYEIEFADGSFPQRMRLVLSDGTTGPHRLLILGGDPPVPDRETRPDQVLDLHGLPEVKEPLPDAPLRSSFNLTTLSSSHGRGDGRLRRLAMAGTPNGPAHVDLDPNFLVFNAFGDVVGTTLIGYAPLRATLKRIETPDPAKKGRLLLEVVPGHEGLKDKYFLVLSPTEAGPHRLLVREGDTLRHVLPLHDPERRYHLTLQPQLAATSSREQQAVGELRKAIGYTFRVKIESGAITEVHIGTEDAGRVDPALKGLTNLKTLDFSGARLGAAGLTNLRHLTRLESLHFSGAPVADAGLESMKHLTGLRYLTFYDCQGITDGGLAHLRGLKNLTHLRLYREDFPKAGQPGAPRITDAGLEHLKGLTNLEHLDLMGQAVTDAGLERLQGLTNLRELYLSGDGITDAGLEHLKGLSRLKYLHLYQTRATPAGQAALKAKLPMLQIGH
jgi:hypothetical protein